MRPPTDRNTGRLRLLSIRDINEAVHATMVEQAPRFAALARDDSKARAVSSFNLFPTPPELARRLVAMMPDLPPEAGILEPSAGTGNLYRALRERYPENPIDLLDISPECCAELYRITEGDQNARILQRDFLEYQPAKRYAAVCMNPPFSRGRDVRHIRHALPLTEKGGKVSAITGNGPRQQRVLQPKADTYEPLPADAFASLGVEYPTAIAVFTA